MRLTGESFIGWTRVAGGGTPFQAFDPAASQPLPTVFRSVDRVAVDRAAGLAELAFPIFSRLPAPARGDLLRAIALALKARAEPLATLAARETGLGVARLLGEIARTAIQLRTYATALEQGLGLDARIDHGDAERQPTPRPDLRSMLRPLGPVAVFGSSNFPFAYSVAGGDTASALIAGCPVVVKAHPAHPGTSESTAALVVDAVRSLGLPEGVFSMLFDAGTEIGAALVVHPAIKAVGFTGSLAGGRALMDLAAARPEPIPVFAEMGSVNPVFILPEALATRGHAIAEGLHASLTLGAGQFCTNPGLHILPSTPATELFIASLGALVGGTPSEPMLTPRICMNYRNGVERLRGAAGVRLIAHATERASQHGAAHLFATGAATFLGNRLLSEEIFGPVTLAIVCDDAAPMLEVAQFLHGQLTASVHGTDEDFRMHASLVSQLERRAGRLVFNGFPTGIEINHSIVHGGPYPAASDGRSTSVGTRAALRFMRPVCYQNAPESLLPDELKESNPLGIPRLVDGVLQPAPQG